MQTPLPEIEGKYQILSKIGAGGMGAVYKVRHRLLDETRVVKIIRPDEDSADFRERFVREARVATRLRHTNVAQIYDFNLADDGTAYMVLEYVEGRSLKEILGEQHLPPVSLTLEIARQTLAALDYLHQKEVVHRDISSDNIMLTTDVGRPVVKLIDLGVAKDLEKRTKLTKTRGFIGKLRYAPPESFESGSSNADHRSDLYSFGLVLYELLTGEFPISGTDEYSLMFGHTQKPVLGFDQSDPEGRVPEDLRRIVLQSLEKKPAKRYQSARAMSGELAEVARRMQAQPAAPEALAEMVRGGEAPVRAVEPTPTPGTTQGDLDGVFLPEKTPSAPRSVAAMSATPPLPTTTPVPADRFRGEAKQVRRIVAVAGLLLVAVAAAAILWRVGRGSADAPTGPPQGGEALIAERRPAPALPDAGDPTGEPEPSVSDPAPSSSDEASRVVESTVSSAESTPVVGGPTAPEPEAKPAPAPEPKAEESTPAPELAPERLDVSTPAPSALAETASPIDGAPTAAPARVDAAGPVAPVEPTTLQVAVPAGTTVFIELQERITSKKKEGAQGGDSVRAHVWRDVWVDDQLVVAAGTPVVMEIGMIQKARIAGRKGRLELDAFRVAGVDGLDLQLDGGYDQSGRGKVGLTVALASVVAWPLVFLKGKQAVLDPGILFDAVVSGDSHVEVPGDERSRPRPPVPASLSVEILYDELDPETKIRYLPLKLASADSAISSAAIVEVNGERVAPVAIDVVGGPGRTVRGQVEFKPVSKHFRRGMNLLGVEAGGSSVQVLLEVEL
jgi:serine/threonine-protein kinase